MGRDVVVAARVTSREKLRRDFIFFLDERLDCPKGETVVLEKAGGRPEKV